MIYRPKLIVPKRPRLSDWWRFQPRRRGTVVTTTNFPTAPCCCPSSSSSSSSSRSPSSSSSSLSKKSDECQECCCPCIHRNLTMVVTYLSGNTCSSAAGTYHLINYDDLVFTCQWDDQVTNVCDGAWHPFGVGSTDGDGNCNLGFGIAKHYVDNNSDCQIESWITGNLTFYAGGGQDAGITCGTVLTDPFELDFGTCNAEDNPDGLPDCPNPGACGGNSGNNPRGTYHIVVTAP